MLANQLNVLLAQRQLSIKQVVDDLGISRSSISNIVNNPTANISTETIDKLCNYLAVTPSDFFLYAPYEVQYGFNTDNEITMAITHDNKRYSAALSVMFANRGGLEMMGMSRGSSEDTDLYVLIADSEAEDFDLISFYDGLPLFFKQQVTNSLTGWIKRAIELHSDDFRVYVSDARRYILSEVLDQLNTDKKIGNISFLYPWSDVHAHIDLKTNKFVK